MAGGRHFKDRGLLERKLDAIFLSSDPAQITIISGCCKGADRLGELYAIDRGMSLIRVPAMWEVFGREQAGRIRNELMAEIATHCVVFWDGVSHGAGMMISIAERRGLPLRVIRYA